MVDKGTGTCVHYIALVKILMLQHVQSTVLMSKEIKQKIDLEENSK